MSEVHLVPLLPNWPILLTTEMAARFLSVDELTFIQIAERAHLKPVNLGVPATRWRRSELERLAARLEPAEHTLADPRLEARRESDEALAQRIVQAAASRVSAAERQPPSLMMSVKEAAKTMGISHSTIYKLINAGRLPTHRLGGRTLVKRADVEALFADGATEPNGKRGRPARW